MMVKKMVMKCNGGETKVYKILKTNSSVKIRD